jgi:type III restriction enzyme, res subunit
MVYQNPKIFPTPNHKNIAIVIKNRWGKEGFLSFITNTLMDNQSNGGIQLFPLYVYEESKLQEGEYVDLFSDSNKKSTTCEGYQRRDAITDEALAHFKTAYPSEDFTKEDMFYYIYGLLHSEEYREKYADNLSKQLPRIPCVKSAVDFWAFSKAGRELAELHLNYETVPMYQNVLFKGGLKSLGDQISGAVGEDFYVEKMKFGKKMDEETGKKVDDKTTVIYNSQFTLTNIPEEAYDYVVNGKPALEWVMERQSVKTDKASGIINDANDWAIETMNNPRYPMELFLRVVTVSLETMRIVRALPKLEI